jgi:class 3 adenylate cyclase/tetratricopeptide (TPR) repeat protein
MRSCTPCGAVLPDGAQFCPACGSRVGTPERAAVMRSERKIVTILFADIKSSIDLVAYRDPEQAGDVLSDVVREMGAAVRAHGGVVNQILGDGVMALFGAPVAIEEHAAQACRAALAMRAGVQEKLLGKVHVRIGIGSGEVVVRAMAGDVTLHYGATGEAVHLASRMEQIAAPDQIVLTPATLEQLGALASVRSLGPVSIKGLDQKIEVFELLGIAERRTRPTRATGSGSFVGRDAELGVLQTALDRAASGRPGAVSVIADAGLGKSRLVTQFTTERLPDEWALSVAEALPHRRTSYGTVAELLRRVFQLAPGDDRLLRQDKLLTGIGLREREAEERILPGLAELLGLPPSPGWSALEPRERRARTIAASAQSLQAASRRRPMALVVEDAHWLDPESAECIGLLADDGDGLRLLTIATERPPESTFADQRNWIQCMLPALDERGARALLAGLVLPGPDVPALERLLMEHTRGNPLFIEECLQALVELGELKRVGERYRLDRPVEALRVPAGLRALLDSRVDRLPDLDKDVLQAASVVGTSVRSDLLRRVAGLEAAALDPVIARLCHAGFLVEIGTGAAHEPKRFGFRHGLIRETAYNGILLRSRVRMHAAVLAALEERGTEEEADLLADHANRAEVWPKAISYARLAGTRALDRYANPESARLFRQALAATEQLADGPEKEKEQLDLHLRVRWPLFRLGHVRDLLPHLHCAADLAARYDDHVQLGQSYALQSHGFWLAGQPDRAEAAAQAARALAIARGDVDLERRSQFQLSLVHLTSGRGSAVIEGLEAVIAHLGPEPPISGRYRLDIDLAITALGYITRAHASAGNFPAAHEALERATRHARRYARQEAWIYVHVAHGVLLLAEGRPHQAVGQLEAAHAACIATDIRLLRPVAAGFLALAYAEAGQRQLGVETALVAVEDADRMGFLALQPLRLAILAQAHLLCGALDEALDAARRAGRLATEIGEPGAGAYATALRGEIALRRGDTGAARTLFRAGLEAAETLKLTPLAACIRQRLEDPDNRAHPWLDGVALAP